ncbi:AfsR/SARP family transcriptional regulator [Micromonospora sp. CPCC 206061]|uniref:AfsR/SARP family transcriptional regulator n=1 Tax=Micromonospora sp. CPCC 206061 TaxID=3122410 RepID=UPI002FF2B8B3
MLAVPSEHSDLAYGVLGPLEVRLRGRLVPLVSPKHRALLATLLLQAGNPVPTQELAVAVWGSHQPEVPRRAVQLIVTRLRAMLGATEIVTRPGGYLIDVPAERLDLGRFRYWLEQADRAAEREDAGMEAAALGEALAQWRGEPLADVPSDLLHRQTVPRLLEKRLQVWERRIGLELRLGRHAELVDELVDATSQHPSRERFWVQLMTALHRSGRRADALAAYQAARRHIADALGIDPGDEMRQLYATVLGGTSVSSAGAGVLPVPRQLPPEASAFAGRAREIAALDELLLSGRERDLASIVVVSGTAGVGKTALALHWSRRMVELFPDGQLWINLRGYDNRPPVTPEQALTYLLRALGVPAIAMPSDVDSQSALYRSLMDGRQTLVVIDNAGAAEHVRPLLPGGPGNAVMVTSRNQLTGLCAADGATLVVLDLFTAEEGREMLARRLGADRVDADPQATAQIVERCARLPLALAVAAARAAQRPAQPLRDFADQLQAARERLDEFASPDTATDARAVFSWSYRTLSEPAARLFRLLGAHPGRSITAFATASLAAIPPAQVRPLLTELADAQLVTDRGGGRYALHDLMRVYATELLHTHDAQPQRHAALRRMLDHYLHTAHTAATLIDSSRTPIPLAPPDAGVSPLPLADREQALAWLGAEYTGLLTAIERAQANGLHTHTWQLVWTLADFQQWRGLWRDRAAGLRAALEATQRPDNRAEQARAHRGLGYAYNRLGRDDDAQAHLQHALDLYTALDEPTGQARAHHGLSYILERQGNHHAALWHAQRALGLYPADSHQAHHARAVGIVGWCHAQLGDHHKALAHCQDALTLVQQTGDRVAEAANWDSLGYIHHHLRNHHHAITCYQTALRIRRELGHRYGEANTLSHLGDTHHLLGDHDAARRTWHNALTILEQLGQPDTDHVRIKLKNAE